MWGGDPFPRDTPVLGRKIPWWASGGEPLTWGPTAQFTGESLGTVRLSVGRPWHESLLVFIFYSPWFVRCLSAQTLCRSLFSTMRAWESNSECQALLQSPLPVEPSQWPCFCWTSLLVVCFMRHSFRNPGWPGTPHRDPPASMPPGPDHLCVSWWVLARAQA